MSDSIIQLLDKLPSDNLTVKVLKALDYVVPGEWENIVGCDNTIVAITGETDADRVMAIRNRAIELYNDAGEGYQRAVWIYNSVDKADAALGAAAMANKVGEKIGFLSFLGKLTPKADTTQSVDLCVKIVAELIAYYKLNGLPSLSPQEFVAALKDNYQGSSLMRMGTLIAVDGLLPLGPNFLQKVEEVLATKGQGAFEGNPVFTAISGMIPSDDKFGFISNTFTAVEGWMGNFVSSTGLTQEKVVNSIGNFVDFSDDSLDFVAAFLDQSTSYYRHTGIQSVARRLILRAAEDA
ncbi:MAG: hypothetical protein SXA11_10820 [Cyanobacteriota bacterium]|nr:hypothetical protein [Cyanobacteriota bacterium]